MTSSRTFIGAIAALAALSLPAFAGEPGPYLKPYTPPVQTTTIAPTTTYSYSTAGTSTSYETRSLNMQSYDQLSRAQAAAPKYVYTRPAPVNPCYQPNPCAVPTTSYRTVTTRTYVAPAPAPAPVYRSAPPAVVNPCYQPNPCAVPTRTYVPAPVPQPTYVPPPQPVYAPVPQPVHWLAIDDCGHKVIRRLKDGRDGERRYEVCYSDLNQMSAYDRNTTLLDRIQLAARKACDDTGFSFYSRRSERNCRNDATEDAVFAANVPGLVEYYYAKTGKRRPNVNVGAPIYY